MYRVSAPGVRFRRMDDIRKNFVIDNSKHFKASFDYSFHIMITNIINENKIY